MPVPRRRVNRADAPGRRGNAEVPAVLSVRAQTNKNKTNGEYQYSFGIYSTICEFPVSALTEDRNRRLDRGMRPTALFLLSSHDHAAALAPLSLGAQISGFVLVLLAACLIVLAVERLRRR